MKGKIASKDVKNDLHKSSKEDIIIIQEANPGDVKMINLETQDIKIKKGDFKNWIFIGITKVRRAMS